MELNEKYAKLYKEYMEEIDMLSEELSRILRALDTKEKRLFALERMDFTTLKGVFKRVHDIAIMKEDYEACEAIVELFKRKGVPLK